MDKEKVCLQKTSGLVVYSDVPNKCAVRLSIVGIKIHEFTFIRHYITVSKIARVCRIYYLGTACLLGTTRLLGTSE